MGFIVLITESDAEARDYPCVKTETLCCLTCFF